MSEIGRIRDQLRRVMVGEAWHGPSLEEAAARIPAVDAHVRVPADGHNARELVDHIAVWLEVARERLAGRPTEPDPRQDWPPDDEGEGRSWEAALERAQTAHAELDRALESVGDADLEAPVVGQPYSAYVLLHGAIQHVAYHAGQLTLLARLLAEDEAGRPG